MLEKTAKNLEKTPKEKNTMDDALRAQQLIQYAFPKAEHGTAERAQERAWIKLGLRTLRRARSIWDGEAKRVDAWELDALREAELEQARKEYVGARNRIEAIRQRQHEIHSRAHSAGAYRDR